MNNESLAELSGVSKRYGKVVALDGMELQVRPAELLCSGTEWRGETYGDFPDARTAKARRRHRAPVQPVSLEPCEPAAHRSDDAGGRAPSGASGARTR